MEQGFIDAFSEAFRPHRPRPAAARLRMSPEAPGRGDLLDEGIKLPGSNWKEQHGRMVADLSASPPAIRRKQSAK
jgi:hypothetical protein